MLSYAVVAHFLAEFFLHYMVFVIDAVMEKKSSTCRVVVAVIISHLFSLVSLEPSNLANKNNQQSYSTAYCFLSFDFPYDTIASAPVYHAVESGDFMCLKSHLNPPHTY